MTQTTTEDSKTAIILLFDALPNIAPSDVARAISSVEPLDSTVKVEIDFQDSELLHGYISFANHKVRIAGLGVPVPAPTVEHTIQVSNWGQEQKAPLLSHKTHILCFYIGDNTNPTEQMIALYKVAYAFFDIGLLGVLDEDAWNCTPRQMVSDLMSTEMLAACRKSVPLVMWTGFVKFFKTDGTIWYSTKGHDRFGVPNFAYLGRTGEGKDVFDIFADLFYYVNDSGAALRKGDTIQIGNRVYLRFGPVVEYQDYLDSPGGTLVIERISASEIN